MSNMRVLLRKRETKHYFAGPNGWSVNASAAHDFETVDAAVEMARKGKLAGIEVVVRDDGAASDLIMPVPPPP